MTEFVPGIMDGDLRRNFTRFCRNWGVGLEELTKGEYIDMIGLYYQEIMLSLSHPPRVVNMPFDVSKLPRG